ncbi:hypothetical protein ACWDUL_25895, partial [Nocardia niigatensis]
TGQVVGGYRQLARPRRTGVQPDQREHPARTRTQTPTPTAGLPDGTTPLGGVTPAPAAGVASAIPAAAVTNSPLAGLTNLFGGLAGLDGDHVQPLVGVAAAPSEPVPVTTTTGAAADPVPEQVDFIRALGNTLGSPVEGNPVVEA